MGQIEPTGSHEHINEPLVQHFAIRSIKPTLLLTFFTGLFVLAVYVWLISCGLWTKWPATSTYYDQLAASFSHGNLALELKPDPALLALPNPYDPGARTGIQAPTDISLYNGKFYLYFGPAPALLLMIARIFSTGEIGDQYLVFFFVAGIFIFQSLLLVYIKERFFPELSDWLVPVGVLVAGLICPIGWILSLPTIYNAAITGGEFFFLAGFYFAFKALDLPSISNWGLAAAGIFWVGALGSRITQVLPIGFTTFMVTIWIVIKYRRMDQIPKSIPSLLALNLTLGVGLAALSWYNWARFGSIFETGITYQLAGPFLQKYHNDLFSPVYVIQNIYNYLLIPPNFKNIFPFLIPVYGNIKPILTFLPLPTIYYSQEIAGYLFNGPFTLFALVPVISLISKLNRHPKSLMDKGDRSLFNWMVTSLMGSFLFGFAFFLVFFWVAMRYFTDFIPALVLLSVIGFWQLNVYNASRPVNQFVITLVGIILIAVSIVASNLIALSINSGRFRASDPILWRQLVNFFRLYIYFK